jgi:hypothetical protein
VGSVVWRRSGEILAHAGAGFLLGWVLSLGITLFAVSQYDHHLYTRLLGRSMAVPDWQPWWGWWLFHTACGGAGVLSALGFGWWRWSAPQPGAPADRPHE